MWMRGLPTRDEAELWLKAGIVPLIKKDPKKRIRDHVYEAETDRKPMNLTEPVAVDQVADHIVALMQSTQVGLRVQDVAEGMIGAVKRQLEYGENKILMQSDMSNVRDPTARERTSSTMFLLEFGDTRCGCSTVGFRPWKF